MSEIIAKTVSVPKTLPMKHKCLMYGAIALWESLKAKGVVCESNFMDVVNLDVAEQIKFLDNMIDVNYLEKEVVKPLQKARKKELADAKKPVKEKKVRAPRAKKATATATATATEPPSVIQTPVSYDKATEELVQELSYEPVVVVPEKEEKKKKPKIRKSTDEKEEKVPKEKVPKEKVPKEKVPKEKVPKEKKPKKKEEEVVKKVEEPQDYWMIFHNNERYWTTDENQKNGELFDNTTDEDGDFGPGRLVGKIENGVIVLN
jgi:hypothetical protein